MKLFEDDKYGWPTIGPRKIIAIMVIVLILSWTQPLSAQRMDSGSINSTRDTGTIMTSVGGVAVYVGGTILEGTAAGAAIVASAPILVVIGSMAVIASIVWNNCWLGTCQSH